MKNISEVAEEKICYYERRKLPEYCSRCGNPLGDKPYGLVCDACKSKIKKWQTVNKVKFNAKRRVKSSKNKVGVLRKLKKYRKIEHIAYKAALYDLITEIGTKRVAELFNVSMKSIEMWTFDEIRTPTPENYNAIIKYFETRGIT